MLRRLYIHQRPDWPRFTWQPDGLLDRLAGVRNRQGRLLGRMEALGFDLQRRAALGTVTEDVVASSRIEGEILDREQVRSSIARRLGMDDGGLANAGPDVEGAVDLTLDATARCSEPLTRDRLFGWHASLFPAGRSGMRRIAAGQWRDDSLGPMQVVSGPIGRERVHFEAPEAARLEREMQAFLEWFDSPADTDEVLKAGLAHLWFVTIHPFDDGNGRIARAIADMALARAEGGSRRFYSMSSQILRDRASYYEILERAQKGTMDVSDWMCWFVDCLGRAVANAETTLGAVLDEARLRQRISGVTLNPRQRLVVGRLLSGFQGKLTTSKWAALAKCSQDTALRDIDSLIEQGVLARGEKGGRSTSYTLVGV